MHVHVCIKNIQLFSLYLITVQNDWIIVENDYIFAYSIYCQFFFIR